jgi:hypothetical protein
VTSNEVEVVRELYSGAPVDLAEIFASESATEAWRSRIESAIHPDFEGGNPTLQGAVFAPLGGLDAFIETWRDWLSAFESWWFEVEEIVPGREGKVAVLLNIRARSKTDRVDMPFEGANVVTVTDGKVSRLHLYFDRKQALEDAGIPEASR